VTSTQANAASEQPVVLNEFTVNGSYAGSLEMAVICDEIINYIQRLLTKVQVNDETLAVDLIRRLGPGSSFLGEKHTRAHIDEIYHPNLFNRQAIISWKKSGELTARDRAREKVRTILREHKIPPLTDEVSEKIDFTLKQASASLTR
jgi:trimethylamine--corrinoid protein Co-methyltransferase